MPRFRFGLLLVVAVVACSGTSRDRMLRVFFDDPPDRTAAASDTTGVPRGPGEARPGQPLPAQAPGSIHSPFEDRDCASCHATAAAAAGRRSAIPVFDEAGSSSMGRLRLQVPELCAECHDDKAGDALGAGGKTVHSPAEDGDCLACHLPHKSEFPALLRLSDPIERLCFECHDASDVLAVEPHGDMEPAERNCIECHDPHASAEEKLLK